MKLAEFTEENGQLKLIKLLINPQEFNVSKDAYFNGDENHSAKEYEYIFREVAVWCNQNKGWMIDDWNNYYTARTTEESEQLRYNALSEEEKKKKDKEIHNKPILKKIDEIKKVMAENDYKQMKYIRGEYTEEEWQEIKSWFQEKALEIRQLESQLL